MGVSQKLKMFVAQEPVVAASVLIAGFGLFLPAVVRPMLDSYQASKQPPQAALSDVVSVLPLWVLKVFLLDQPMLGSFIYTPESYVIFKLAFNNENLVPFW
ncbi:hypothetical protein Lal_00036420 [Lupinus albus]|nr:hypothetical protein Lal_00036420 [Lupinus albus]